jgi:predicted transcriptional regulator of viral defense system
MHVLGDKLPPTFTTRTARELGVHPRELYAWRDAGEITELSRGVFRRADAPPASYPDILAVAYRAPRAVICCLSAAVVHELTDELPGRVQVAVPKGSHPPEISYPPASVLRFDAETFELGLSAFEAAPEERVRVYDAARTVADLMRLRHRFGEPAAHIALNRYLSQPTARPALLLTYARALGIFGPMRTALDIASSR